ncbi:unnamed protein product [Nippostrongylus brasiliensis]|uniref:Uncharacterized protein n=1 Tax=Nippostrongylus brasiliensis TaxID=27835 RepID=A0A0N4YSB6_NIPBR|nr:unnamed protein product [Nippostrongylus brasiliensis]
MTRQEEFRSSESSECGSTEEALPLELQSRDIVLNVLWALVRCGKDIVDVGHVRLYISMITGTVGLLCCPLTCRATRNRRKLKMG